MPKLTLLDGDGFLYRIAASMEKTIHGVSWVSPHSLLSFGEFPNWRAARQSAEERGGRLWQRREIGTIDAAIARLGAAVQDATIIGGSSDTMFVVSGVRNFRDQVGTIRKYKGNRDATARPALLGELRAWAADKYKDNFLQADNMEADDLISILVHEELDPSEILIVSNDKDLRQIAGYHWNWVTREREYISPESAEINLYKQVLTGDVGDNVAGCWGIGPSKAEALARDWVASGWDSSMIWGSMVDTFEKSQKVEGCPYKDMEAEEAAEETYKLIHLLEYFGEAEDILRDLYSCQKNNETKKGQNAKIKEESRSHESDTSKCAPSATEADKKESGQPAQSATG